MTDDLTKAYSSIYNKEEESKPEQVQEVIGAVLGAATALNAVNNVRKAITKKPKTRYLITRSYINYFLSRIIPDRILDRIIGKKLDLFCLD